MFRYSAIAMVACLGIVRADDPPKIVIEAPREGIIARVTTLVPERILVQLDLSDEQRKQIQQLEMEFGQKNRGSLMQSGLKIYSTVNQAQRPDVEPDANPGFVIAHEITGGLLNANRLRTTYDKKVQAVLNEKQRTEYVRLLKAGPPPIRESRKVEINFGDSELLLFSRTVQDKLGLDEAQKKKLDEIQRETESKLRALLTDEQRKKYEAILDGRGKDLVEKKDRRKKN